MINNSSQYTWVVDPIDGTSNFASGIPTYCIMIGLLNGGIPIAGGVAIPSFHEICIAEKAKALFVTEKVTRHDGGKSSSLSCVLWHRRTSGRSEVYSGRVCTSCRYYSWNPKFEDKQ